MQCIQNKIDKLIKSANYDFNNNHILNAIIDYNKALELVEFLGKKYDPQIHEIYARNAMCFDILGNFANALESINKALSIIPNTSSLILYKAVLLQSLNNYNESSQVLEQYKKICVKSELINYEILRLIFIYTSKPDSSRKKLQLLKEITEFLDTNSANKKAYIAFYLRAMTYLDLSKQNDRSRIEFTKKYEADIRESKLLEPEEAETLINEGISHENLSKLFFMILPELDNYQPKALAEYSTFHQGFKIFYVIMKAIKLFQIKVKKTKLKAYCNNKLKCFMSKQGRIGTNDDKSNSSKDISSISNNNCSNESFIQSNYNNKSIEVSSNNETKINKSSTANNSNNSNLESSSQGALKGPIINNETVRNKLRSLNLFQIKSGNLQIKNAKRKSSANNLSKITSSKVGSSRKESIDIYVESIKKDYENKVKALYQTMWLHNIKYSNEHEEFDTTIDCDTNYFIKNKYYSPYNLASIFLNLMNSKRCSAELGASNSFSYEVAKVTKTPGVVKKKEEFDKRTELQEDNTLILLPNDKDKLTNQNFDNFSISDIFIDQKLLYNKIKSDNSDCLDERNLNKKRQINDDTSFLDFDEKNLVNSNLDVLVKSKKTEPIRLFQEIYDQKSNQFNDENTGQRKKLTNSKEIKAEKTTKGLKEKKSVNVMVKAQSNLINTPRLTNRPLGSISSSSKELLCNNSKKKPSIMRERKDKMSMDEKSIKNLLESKNITRKNDFHDDFSSSNALDRLSSNKKFIQQKIKQKKDISNGLKC